jgi:hypothetical protein
MSWGYFMRGSDQQIEVEELGSKLSSKINCSIHYPAYGKKLYECNCGIIFPHFLVKGAEMTDGWQTIIDIHEGKIQR